MLNGSKIEHETALSLCSGSVAATTEAGIDLAGKDFAIDLWVNISGAGTILSHGKGSKKLNVGVNADGKLEVEIAGTTYTSSNNIPKNKWAFLTLSYSHPALGSQYSTLNAKVATADSEATLFTGKAVAAYDGNGPLSVGGGSVAAMHELLLWDEAHDMTTALMNCSVTKNPSTRHLVCYWKMDEGEGTTIRDYSRSRNMTMADETWYLNNVNKAVSLSGGKYLSLYTADSPYNLNDDYAVELWMRANKQNGEAQLLQAGQVGLWLDSYGRLQLAAKGAGIYGGEESIATSSSVLTDNAWHHVALNVLRQGAAAVYVDGNRVLTTNAASVGHISTDHIYVGAHRAAEVLSTGELTGITNFNRPFTGQIDEVRVWNATLNGDKLNADRKLRFTGKEAGLVAYYPFETKKLDNYNQVVTEGIDYDLVHGDDTQHHAVLYDTLGVTYSVSYTDEAPALRTKRTETNVSYTYVASDDKIVIELDEDPATIEGCTINFTVRSARDENGNYSVPAIWSAFVNRNELVWQEDDLNLTLPVKTSSSVTATIVNKGGQQQMWTLAGMPSWLQASSEYGTTNPKGETKVTFTVSPATPIGKYEETIYLKGNNGIETPLTLKVKVKGDEPDWAIDDAYYRESMNIISNFFILDEMSEDEDDIVAAFIDDECRGVAHPVYDKRYDSYFVTMDIYDIVNDDDADEKVDNPSVVEFKAYDASTGIIYPVVNSYLFGNTAPDTVFFNANDLMGRYATPIKLAATDEVEQNIDLAKGWTWTALGVKPKVFTVKNVFSKTHGKVEFVKSFRGSAEFDGDDWLPDTMTMNNREMYAVQASEAMTLSVIGHKVKNDEEPISVKDGWSWVAFNGLSVMSLNEGLADMQPQNDEIIKGQRGVAYYDRYEWKGSLKQLTPGLGYKIQGKKARTFTYPTKTATGAAARSFTSSARPNGTLAQARTSHLPTFTTFTPVDYHNYPGNMVLIAQLVAGGEPVEGVELGVFASVESEESVVDYECREDAVSDERGMIIITIPGDKPCELTFRVSDGESSIFNLQSSITYENDAVVGTPKAPFIIDLGQATGIVQFVATESQQTGQVFDMQGRKVELNDQGRKLRKGVYIVNGQKKVK